jgi:hypothetical protein
MNTLISGFGFQVSGFRCQVSYPPFPLGTPPRGSETQDGMGEGFERQPPIFECVKLKPEH